MAILKRLGIIAAITSGFALSAFAGRAFAGQQCDPQCAAGVFWGPESRGFQLGLASTRATYRAGASFDITVFERNDGAPMAVAPFESNEVDTLIRDASGTIVSPKNRPELNTTGESVFVMRTGTVVKEPLSIGQSYNLGPGSYALTVSFDVYRRDAEPGWYTHLMSPPMQLTVTK